VLVYVLPAAVTEYAAASYDYEARLCHLKMWPDFAGYGFNLHADRATPGQFVGKVDEGSPAEAAGLRLNDRIVEVNGHSVEGRSHADVVADVKSVSGEVRLLVVDASTDEMCRQSGVVLSSSCLTNVQTIICPDSNPYTSMGSVQCRHQYATQLEAPSCCTLRVVIVRALGQVVCVCVCV